MSGVLLRQLRPALTALVAFTLLAGVAYPLMVTGAAQLFWNDRSNGSVLRLDGRVAGSTLLAQPVEGPGWFEPRPSATGHDATDSGASNLGPTNPELLTEIGAAADAYRERNGLPPGAPVPIDAVTASGSGLDPHISPRNARLQAPRVATERGLDLAVVMHLVAEHTEGRTAAILGEPRVNVVTLNAALAQRGG